LHLRSYMDTELVPRWFSWNSKATDVNKLLFDQNFAILTKIHLDVQWFHLF
jgi:hypothetical protein